MIQQKQPMARTTLPQRRAIETRGRIIDAAAHVFSRRGYGQATVQDIADEAEISMGALYHHFSSKEELFRAIMDEHIRRDMLDYEPRPSASSREAIEHFVEFQLEHMAKEPELRGLSMELWAQAGREEWARTAAADAFRVFRDVMARLLTIAQEAGVARRDLDVPSAALLLEALFVGVQVQRAVEPDEGDVPLLVKTWADLLERFVRADTEGDIATLDQGVNQLFQELREEPAESPRAGPIP